MSQNVFILGAGASRECGAPLMADFLDKAELIQKEGQIIEGSDFQLVFRALHALQSVHAKSQLDTQNIESVFAAFEMAGLLGTLGSFSQEDIGALASAMRHVIIRTLENSIQCSIQRDAAQPLLPPRPYGEFAKLLKDMSYPSWNSVSVITFNYDVGIDYGLAFHDVPIDWCLEATSVRGIGNSLDLMKLHGSLNWARCDDCNLVHRFDIDFGPAIHAVQYYGAKSASLVTTTKIKEVTCNRCRKHLSDSMIVPPTWNKTQYHTQLVNVWSKAARHLSEAKNIFVIGYSLPETDYFFRHLFALGSIGPIRLQRFWVFNPDESVEERYHRLMGPEAKSRFKLWRTKFSDAIGTIRSELGVEYRKL